MDNLKVWGNKGQDFVSDMLFKSGGSETKTIRCISGLLRVDRN
jgi:hypothetical protein